MVLWHHSTSVKWAPRHGEILHGDLIENLSPEGQSQVHLSILIKRVYGYRDLLDNPRTKGHGRK